MSAAAAVIPTAPLRIDLGAGKNKREGYLAVDSIKFEGVDVVCHIGRDVWPWDDNSVDAANCSHTLEHLTNLDEKWERVHFFNELYRVLKPGAECALVFPHWASNRFYGDPTHKEPFSEFGFYYLDQAWRKVNAPHADYEQAPGPQSYTCNFIWTYGYSLHPHIQNRSSEYVTHAMTFYKDACQDIIATLKKPA